MNLIKFLTEALKPYRIKAILTNGEGGEIRLTRKELFSRLQNTDNLGGIKNILRLMGLDARNLATDLEYFNISNEKGSSFELRRTLSKKAEDLPFEITVEAIHKKAGGRLNIVDVTDIENKFDKTRDSIINKELIKSLDGFKKIVLDGGV